MLSIAWGQSLTNTRTFFKQLLKMFKVFAFVYSRSHILLNFLNVRFFQVQQVVGILVKIEINTNKC